MNFKKKVRRTRRIDIGAIALALAVMFSGVPNLALAVDLTGNVDPTSFPGEGMLSDNMSAVGEGISTLNTDALLKGSDGQLILGSVNYSIALDALDLVGANNVTALTIDNTNNPVNIAGNGDALFTSNGRAIENVALTGSLQLGSTTNKSLGGSMVNLELANTGVSPLVFTVSGGAFDITGSLIVTSGDITVGAPSDAFSASLNVNNLQMADSDGFSVGADFGLDRAKAAIGSFGSVGSADLSDTAINVGLLSFQNSTITVGSANSGWIDNIIAGLDGTTPFNTWTVDVMDSGLAAAFGLFSPQRLLYGSGGISIGGIFANPNIFSANDYSLTAINLANVDANNAAFSMVDINDASAAFDGIAIGTMIDDTDSAATIYLDNAKAGTYKIFDNVDNTDIVFGGSPISGNQVLTDAELGEYWNYNYGTMVFSSGLMQGEWELAAGDINSDLLLHVSRNDLAVQDVFTKMQSGMATLVDQIYVVDSLDSNNAGVQFVSNATSSSYVPDRKDAAAILEGAAQMPVAGGVPYITNNVISKTNSLIVSRNLLIDNETEPFGIWVTPFYGAGDVDGMSAGRLENGFELGYSGAAFGMDYGINKAFRLGLAMNIGGGTTDNDGSDFSNTENDFDFFGATLYGSYSNKALDLVADLGFIGVDSEITQDLPASFGMGGKLKGDVESNAFTAGITGKYNFMAGEKLNIASYAGLRYTKVSTDDSTVKLADGRKVFDISVDDMSLFQIPMGVEFSGSTVTDGGWTITPKADLGILLTMGADVDTHARIPDTSLRTGAMNADVIDSTSFTGALGITAAAGNGLSLNAGYGLLTSSNQTIHQLSGTLRYEF